MIQFEAVKGQQCTSSDGYSIAMIQTIRKASAPLVLLLAVNVGTARAQKPDTSRAGNEQVAEIMRTYGGRGVMADDSQPTPAAEAVKQFRVRDGFEMQLVAGEPEVSQPLFLSWDSRGRMWVVHYRQYQFPAGLKVIRYDQHLRAVFDKVPDPPPHGTLGADKITVHEDTDDDGVYDSYKDVITGLNIATSVAVGDGAIWVLNPPYLLRYADANRDDVPDSDPEVHLSGFGLQDTHSVSNSLIFSPDGWLYGSNGSTTVGDVSSEVTKGVRFQGQCVWRYHPKTKVFEIFAEGGGNTFSLEIDSKGRVFAGHNGGDTRGWYFPQGSYSAKNWGKHGALTNPYAFGFFRHMKLKGDKRRFPQAFCIYEGGLYPKSFDGSIVAPNALHNLVWHSKRIPDGSTYRTEDDANLVESPDRWFRPVYSGVGPDGAVYISDWYDTRLSHVSPTDDWHKESGRIYRIIPTGSKPKYEQGDLHSLTSLELIQRFEHPNKWVRRRASMELGWRADEHVVDQLMEQVETGSLEALWSLNLMDQMTTKRAQRWLSNQHADVRRWVVRLLGDRHESVPGLADLAASEENIQVRSQLASTAKRVSADMGIPIVEALIRRDEDISDPHMPLMVWWALEAHADAWPQIESMLEGRDVWSSPMFHQHLASRLMQRYAAAGKDVDLHRCAKLLAVAPSDGARRQLMIGLNRAFQGRSLPKLPESLEVALKEYRSNLGDSGLMLGIRQGDQAAVDRSIEVLSDRSADLVLQLEIAKTLGEVDQRKSIPLLIRLATGNATAEPSLQRVAIGSLVRYDSETIPKSLVVAFGSQISGEHGLRATACRALASRPAWAKVLLDELNAWRVRRDQVPADVVQQLRTYQQPEIAEQVEQAFGQAVGATAPEQIAEITRIREIVSKSPGNAEQGKTHFVKLCANCHQLFGEGKKVGPPLDGYQRDDLNFWLNAIVVPSLEIREGFQSYLALTVNGRTINGMIAAQDERTVTLRNADNHKTVLERDAIESLTAIPTSLMPAELLQELTEDQIRDLLAYLSMQNR